MTWTIDGQPLVLTDKNLIEIGGGEHTIRLTVDDYRGGVATSDRLFTVNTNVFPEWNQWYGPEGSGWIERSNTNWLQNWPPIVKWTRADIRYGGYGGNGSPVVSDERVYCSNGGGMYCLNARTGERVWSQGFAGGNPTPCVDEDSVYAVSYMGCPSGLLEQGDGPIEMAKE